MAFGSRRFGAGKFADGGQIDSPIVRQFGVAEGSVVPNALSQGEGGVTFSVEGGVVATSRATSQSRRGGT